MSTLAEARSAPAGRARRAADTIAGLIRAQFDADVALLSRYAPDASKPELLETASLDDDEIGADFVELAAEGLALDRGRRTEDASGEVRPATVVDRRILRVCVRPTPTTLLVLAAARRADSPPFDHEEERLFVAQGPLLAKLVRLWWEQHSSERRAQALCRALDMSEVGVLLFDADLNLVHTNHQAAMLLAAENGLRRVGPTVGATSLDDAIKLQTALRHAIDHNQSVLRPRAGEAPILSVRRRDRRPLIASIIPAGVTSAHAADPAAILFVLDPEQDVLMLLDATCRLYGLTASESRLTGQLVAGLALAEAAKAMRISVDTAKAYLKQVFAKTGTHRQSDLMRLMLTSVMRTPASLKVSAVP